MNRNTVTNAKYLHSIERPVSTSSTLVTHSTPNLGNTPKEKEKKISFTLEVLISHALTSGLNPPQMKTFDSVGWNFSALILNSVLLLNICFPKIK